MAKKLVLTAATGPRACGKTTFLDILEKLFNEPNVVMNVEVSDILRWHTRHHTDVGRKLAQHLDTIVQTGGYVPDELVIRACVDWLEIVQQKHQQMSHLLLGGFPRTKEQIEMLAMFEDSRVIHLNATKEQAFASMLERAKKGQVRSDCSSSALEENWKNYTERTVPAVKSLNERALQLERSQPLLDRVRQSIDHLPIPSGLKHRLHNRLNTPNHPARMKIAEIESSGSIKTETPAPTNTYHRRIPNCQIVAANMSERRMHMPITLQRTKLASMSIRSPQ